MTIVGTILDYNHLKNHHTLGKLYTDGQRVQSQVLLQLDNYAQSLVRFEQQASALDYQDIHHTKTVVAYANLVIQVSRVLLAGKWDPMSLFDDRDLFMATPSFTTTIANAIAAADNVSHILDVDPDLGFVPYFLGIQLLQGSLPLLLIVDRLQTETDPKIINACEVIIRATEACVSTLDTEYQVSNFHHPKMHIRIVKRGYVQQMPAQAKNQQLDSPKMCVCVCSRRCSSSRCSVCVFQNAPKMS